jgi:glucose-1-phosphate adenylyltransferase
MQMYGGNLWLCAQLGSPELESRFAHLNRGRMPGGDIRIERGGTVKSSFLAAGTVVEGQVEGSVLFPGVSVRRGAVVYQSIVMSNNCIGAKAQMSRALILPRFGENGGGSPLSRQGLANIGEDSVIGQRSSSAANQQYPTQLREGLTVLGANAHVPRGFTIGPGCLLGAEVGPQQLRGMKELRKGSTILCSTGP